MRDSSNVSIAKLSNLVVWSEEDVFTTLPLRTSEHPKGLKIERVSRAEHWCLDRRARV